MKSESSIRRRLKEVKEDLEMAANNEEVHTTRRKYQHNVQYFSMIKNERLAELKILEWVLGKKK